MQCHLSLYIDKCMLIAVKKQLAVYSTQKLSIIGTMKAMTIAACCVALLFIWVLHSLSTDLETIP